MRVEQPVNKERAITLDSVGTRRARTNSEAIELALKVALLAPSPRDIQPWAFHVSQDEVMNLTIDRARSRPVADPDSRELTISCGVALHFLRFALASVGAKYVVTMHPDRSSPNLLAEIRLTGEYRKPDPRAKQLVRVALQRRTNWHQFLPVSVPDGVVAHLIAAASSDGALLTAVADQQRPLIEYMVAAAHHRQLADPKFVAELKRWPVGRPGTSNPPFAMISTEIAAANSPGRLLALSTIDDTEAQWLVAGQALADVLLTATRLGIAITFANQPIQVSEARAELRRIVGVDGQLQQLLRVGYASDAAEWAPRRSLDEVLAQDNLGGANAS